MKKKIQVISRIGRNWELIAFYISLDDFLRLGFRRVDVQCKKYNFEQLKKCHFQHNGDSKFSFIGF